MKTIKKQQLQFLGHCMRKDGIEKLALTSEIAGKRARGRQKTEGHISPKDCRMDREVSN